MREISACDLCGGTAFDIVTPVHSRDVFVTGLGTLTLTIGTKMCRKCGFVFLSPRMDNKELDTYYNAHSRYVKGFDELAKSSYAKLCEMQYAVIKKACGSQRGNALEVGAAEGFFLSLLAQDGYQTVGVEPATAYKEFYAKNFPNLKMHFDMLENTSLPKSYFNLCVMRHVLEHVESPSNILKLVNNLLVENGILYLEVPNLVGAQVAMYDYFHEQHLSYFNTQTLEYACNLAGFTCNMIEEWNDNPDGSGFNYPILRVIARKTHNSDKKICPDSTLSRTAIADYLERKDLFIGQHVRPLEDKIVQWHTMGKRMALFGGGPHTAELLQVLKIPVGSFICAFDNDPLKWGKTVGNVLIIPPRDIDRYKPDIVIISSREFENEIADSLKKQRESGITVVKIYNG